MTCVCLSVCLSVRVQRLKTLLRPTKYWGPALVEHRQLVDYVEHFVVDPWTDDDITTDSQTLAQAIDDNVRFTVLAPLPPPVRFILWALGLRLCHNKQGYGLELLCTSQYPVARSPSCS